MSTLSNTAKAEAAKCFHENVMKTKANFQEIISYFPKWTEAEADGNWCAAFVYYCWRKAQYEIPIMPAECVSCNLAGCGAWAEWAQADNRIEYYDAHKADTNPKQGDIVLFNGVFNGSEHDHIGIVILVDHASITVAEGNINNISGILQRKRDEHIRAYHKANANKAIWG